MDDSVNWTSPLEPQMEINNSGVRIINDTPVAIKNKMTATAVKTLNTVQMSKSVEVFKIFDTAHAVEKSPGFVTDRQKFIFESTGSQKSNDIVS